jgi:hypothetical protein
MNVIKNGGRRRSGQDKNAWEKHSGHDEYMTVGEIKALAEKHIPGAAVKRRLFWRYALVWEK